MKKAILVAACVAAVTFTGGAYAQTNTTTMSGMSQRHTNPMDANARMKKKMRKSSMSNGNMSGGMNNGMSNGGMNNGGMNNGMAGKKGM